MAATLILVVEDEAIVAEDIRDSLERSGYNVAIASSGTEAIDKAGETRPALVMMDIMLKGDMDGVEAAERIRSRFDIPAIYLTAYSDKDRLERAKATEPYGYLLKPFEERALHAAIQIALYKREMEEKLRQAQRALIQSEKLATVGRFSSGIVHEVKNPLAIAVSGLDYLGMKLSNVDTDIKTAVEKVKESVLRASDILGDLLKFARPSALEIGRLDPDEVIKDALSLLKYRVYLRNIEIITQSAEEGIYIEIDRNQIQQVLLNLLTNAVDAMPHGGKIKIRAYKTSLPQFLNGQPCCVIEVADTGEGISKEDALPRIFEPFFTTKRGKGGIGLGLSISKMIVNNYDGDLVIDSELGKGTNARVLLPLARL